MFECDHHCGRFFLAIECDWRMMSIDLQMDRLLNRIEDGFKCLINFRCILFSVWEFGRMTFSVDLPWSTANIRRCWSIISSKPCLIASGCSNWEFRVIYKGFIGISRLCGGKWDNHPSTGQKTNIKKSCTGCCHASLANVKLSNFG